MDYIQLALDVMVFVLLSVLVKRSLSVEMEIRNPAKLLVPFAFLFLAVAEAVGGRGTMRIVQVMFLLVAAGMSLLLKSGFSPKGLVTSGSLVPYAKMKHMSLAKKDGTFSYTVRNTVTIMIDPGKIDEVKDYLARHGAKT